MVPELIDVKLYFQFGRPQCVTGLHFYLIGKKSLTMNNHLKSNREKTFINITFFLITNVIHICSWIFRKGKKREKKPIPQRWSLCTFDVYLFTLFSIHQVQLWGIKSGIIMYIFFFCLKNMAHTSASQAWMHIGINWGLVKMKILVQ